MRIRLPNGKRHELDTSIELQHKIRVVNDLIEEWRPVIEENWFNNSVKYFLDSLSNYLVWHKDKKTPKRRGKENKHILSQKKIERLNKYKKGSKEILFSDLRNKELLGENRDEV